MDITGFDDKIDLTEGEWVDSIPLPGFEGVSLKVRSANYRPFTRARDRSFRKIDGEPGTDAWEDALWQIGGEVMAEHLLLDWKGVSIGKKATKFDKDLARRLLMADDPHGIGESFRRAVDWASSQVAARLKERTDKLAKN